MTGEERSERGLRILAVGAHPDDLEFGCGGILLKEAERGSEISLCVCSRGEAGTNGTPNEREAEARAAAKLLGALIDFLEMGGDCHLAATPANALLLARSIRNFQPTVLLAPTQTANQHPDHIAVGQLCVQAARLARYGGLEELRDLPAHRATHVFGFAVTPGAEPARDAAALRIDISVQFERWQALMECHRTQLQTRRYLDLQNARARLCGLEAGVEYAQALFPTDDFLVDSLGDLPPSVRLF
ncbi:MAG: PIG-L family deacetylase [Chthoniobacterales bacterium]